MLRVCHTTPNTEAVLFACLVMLDFPEMIGQTHLPKPEQHSPLIMFPAHWHQPLQRLDTLATLCGDEIFLTTLSLARFLPFPQRNCPSPSHPLWIVPTSLPRSQPSLVLLSMQDKTEEIFFQRLRTPSAGSNSPPPGLPCIWAFPARHVWHYFHFWPLVQTLGRGPTVGSPLSSSTLLSLGRGRVAPPPRPEDWKKLAMREVSIPGGIQTGIMSKFYFYEN